MELAEGEEHGYGYRLLTECLRTRYDLNINEKKVYRLCDELKLLHPQRRKKGTPPRRVARPHKITGPNQLWQLDIKYGYIEGYDRFIFIADMIDVFDRNLVGYYKGPSCDAQNVCDMVREALDHRLPPGAEKPIIRTDNGPQFISKKFAELAEELKFVHERIPPKTPNMNAYIESFHAELERWLLRKESFQTFEAAYEAIDAFIEFYNNRKMHHSLKRKSPVAFMQWVTTTQPDLTDFYRAV